MKYTVVWIPSAERRLTEIWLESSDREAVTLAARHIDRDLETRPLDVGESRESVRRIILSGPLGVAYSIREDDMLVRVLRVWPIRRQAN